MEHGEAAQATRKANDSMRQHWNDIVRKEFYISEYYTSVAVLLIRWADQLDDWSECGAEVLPFIHSRTGFRWCADEISRLRDLKMCFETNMGSQREASS